MNPKLPTEGELGTCWTACAKVNPDNPQAAADALGELLDVAGRIIRHFGGHPSGPRVTDAPLELAARAAWNRARGVT
jgi:hypothetical protein